MKGRYDTFRMLAPQSDDSTAFTLLSDEECVMATSLRRESPLFHITTDGKGGELLVVRKY
jgi:hypothetical protein